MQNMYDQVMCNHMCKESLITATATIGCRLVTFEFHSVANDMQLIILEFTSPSFENNTYFTYIL